MEQGDATGNSQGIAIGHLALRRGLITPEQLREALSEQSRSGFPGGTLRPLDTILLSKGFLTRDQLEQLHLDRETASFPIPAVPPIPPADPQPPASVGKYLLVREAGRGAMAKVYEALDTDLGRKVALKMLLSSPNAHPEESRIEEARFLREARLSAGLPKHPNIVGIYDAGVSDGRRYLAMEFVDGLPMDKWMKQGTVAIGRPTTLLRDVALAVHHAHSHGIIHRDLKPANILVDRDNKPHITDFGLAKIAGQNAKASYTEGGFAVGTPAYMSPEQVQGAASVDHRTDIYSLGVMLYEILTGRLPFSGSTPMEIMQKAAKDPVVPPSKITTVQINPVHFKTLESICLRALSKHPRDRYPSCRSFAADLSRWLRGEDFRIADRQLRRRALWAFAALAGFALVGTALARKPWLPPIEQELSRADGLLRGGKPDEALLVYTETLRREEGNPRARAGRDAALAKLREKPAPPPPAAPPPDPWARAIDVLPSISLGEDLISGKWVREDGTLVSREGRPARVQVPYRPPDEYDVRIVFARQAANYCVNLILSRDGQPFTLVMNRDGYFGFERLVGMDFNRNASTRRFDTALQLNRPYTVVVEVRNSGVRSFCDGQPVSVLDSYDGLAMNPDWKLPDPAALGLGTWDGGAAIQKLEIREVTGKGSFIRPPPQK